MNKLCRNALASCFTVSLAVGGGIAVSAESNALLEQGVAVAGMAISLDNYYASSQVPEADIMDNIGSIVSAAKEEKTIPVVTVRAVTEKDGAVVFGTDLVSEDTSEQEEAFVIVDTVYKDGDCKLLEIPSEFVKFTVNEEFAGFVRVQDISPYMCHAQVVFEMCRAIAYHQSVNDETVPETSSETPATTSTEEQTTTTTAEETTSTTVEETTTTTAEETTSTTVEETTTTTAEETTSTTVEETTTTTAEETTSTTVEETTTTTAEETTSTTVEETTTTTAEETTSTTVEETTTTTAEETTSTTVEETTTTTAEETTSTTVEETTTTTAEETTSTTVEETTTTTAEETTSTTVEDTTATTSQETVKSIQSIEAYYIGSSKTEGEVISASELYIVVTYTDGTTETVTEGWSCDQVGMMLSAGTNVITVNYQGFSSSFEVNVATIAPSSETPASTSPDETSSETVPDDTPAPVEEPTSTTAEETQPFSSEEPTTSTTAEETTTTTTAEETTTTTTAEETTNTVEETITPSNNSTPLRDAIVDYALSWVGQCNYVYGGADLSIGGSVDCSGFTMQVYSRVANVSLPHHSMSQMNYGSAITYDQLRPGDLVFYNNPNHVAIYIGNDAIVHAGSPETGINVTSVFFKTPIGYCTYLP